jgi:parallel beta-helix repeat protein
MNLYAKLKKRKILTALTLTVLLFSVLWMLNVQPSNASKTLAVPQDYRTINAAISHASAGDVISVQAGTYNENLQINKSISIVGADAKNTIVIGEGRVERGAHAVVTIAADNVEVSGFTIESQNYSSSTYYATGIIIQGDHAKIAGNIIQSNYMGIFCSIQSNTEIAGNTITANLKDGIRFFGGSNNKFTENNITRNGASGLALEGYSNIISKNKVENNYRGIGFGSSYSVIFGNNISSNTESGIFFAGSQNTISANNFSANKWGIFITPQLAASHDNSFFHNNFLGNVYSAFDNTTLPVETWDNGAVSGGNFWSDYRQKYPNASESGSSGIGDTPYMVSGNNSDNYPFMTQFDTSNLGNAPSLTAAPTAAPNSLVAAWPFDTFDSNRVTPDSTGKNPAVLGSTTAVKSYIPMLVDGKIGKAFSFDGSAFVNVPPSLSIETPEEAAVDAWVNVQSFKDGVAYNNILIEAVRSAAALPTRTFGVAINGEAPQNASSPAVGAIRGYVVTRDGGFNEIVTKQYVVPLNQWIHVVFTRSTTSGMHIYVNGKEQAVFVTSGTANPQGSTVRQNEIYIGHDAVITIDQLQISNTAEPLGQPIWMQWWLWTAIIFAALAVSGFLLFYHKRSGSILKKSKLQQ